jgi:hypothetical protein
MTDAAARMRAYRERREIGRRVLHIEVELGPLGDLLRANGDRYLSGDWDLEDAQAVARGLQKLVEDMSHAHAEGKKFYLV